MTMNELIDIGQERNKGTKAFTFDKKTDHQQDKGEAQVLPGF